MTAVAERVAILDDNEDDADAMKLLVMAAGYEPLVLRPPFGELSQLVQTIANSANAAVCDHRLRGLANFSGAEAVADLVNRSIPAVLVTQYFDIDADVSIRRWRHRIPALLSRDEADPDRIREALTECSREIRGETLSGRRPWRTLLQIDDVSQESGWPVVDARIFSWNPREIVRFPKALVPEHLSDQLVPGAFFFAMVNIGADRPEDLYFDQFEKAPEPIPEEELG